MHFSKGSQYQCYVYFPKLQYKMIVGQIYGCPRGCAQPWGHVFDEVPLYRGQMAS